MSSDSQPLSLLNSCLARTPRRRRRKIPSFSPRKKAKHEHILNQPSTAHQTTPQKQPLSTPSDDTPLSEVLKDPFPDIPLWDDSTSTHRNPNADERMRILDKLREKWPKVAAFTVSFPWMLIEIDMDADLPPFRSTPFLICGLVAVFIHEGDAFPAGVGFFGLRGEGPSPPLPESVTQDLRLHHIPSVETFTFLHKLIPSAQHISSYPLQLLFELPALPEIAFQTLLAGLPKRIGGLTACYHNGDLLMKSYARVIEPDPRQIDEEGDGKFDDADYLDLANGGVLGPGCMLECRECLVDGVVSGAGSSNSGIVVARNGEKRMTVAAHTWDADDNVYHRKTNIGKMVSVVGEDIGLVDVTVPVHNKFLSTDVSAKRLIQSTGVYMGDKMLVDNCYTGSQILFCHGLRTGKKRQPAQGPRDDTFYIILEQGIYATNTPFIPRPPQIRLGMCGTPLLRLESSIDPNAKEGDICGFFLWTDLKGYNGSVLYAYSQLTDPLIEEGWSVLVDS